MTFVLKILGSNSAAPAHNRHQTSQLLNIQNQLFLIDCGEGTQMQLSRYKVKISKINHIFISHMHGDHYLGLMGLISTMHLQGRRNDLYIYAPPPLAEIITLQLKHSNTILNYPIHFTGLQVEASETIYENEFLTIKSLPLNHRIPCTGFIFWEKKKLRKINKEKLPLDISLKNIIDLKYGKDVLDAEGNVLFKNDALTLPPRRSRSYAYCSDTIYNEPIIQHIQSVDLLYHEATFLSDREERARETHHSTARQAATIAKKAQVNTLVLGHYSIRYKDLNPILEEAKEVFENTILAIEGDNITIND